MFADAKSAVTAWQSRRDIAHVQTARLGWLAGGLAWISISSAYIHTRRLFVRVSVNEHINYTYNADRPASRNPVVLFCVPGGGCVILQVMLLSTYP